jgi:hypothetical protein
MEGLNVPPYSGFSRRAFSRIPIAADWIILVVIGTPEAANGIYDVI